MIVFSPLAQGLLTDRYLAGAVPAGSRAAVGHFLTAERLSRDVPRARPRPRRRSRRAGARRSRSSRSPGCCATQRVTSALIGASSVAQLEDNVAALAAGPLTADEIAAIEAYAVDGTAR